jgi:SAM-dependent methyltransferase
VANEFDARDYWEGRLSGEGDLRDVGFSTLGEGFNTWAYRVRRANFARAVRATGMDLASSSVLDVGSGTGFWIKCWQDLGVRSVAGIDLTDAAVARLRRAFPGVHFEQRDVGGSLPLSDTSHDAVSAVDVMFHIVDDDAFGTALSNIRVALRPGGLFIWSDGFVRHEALRDRHVAFRRLADVQATLASAGFRVESRRPLFVLMNPPVDTRRAFPRRAWAVTASALARSEGVSTGAARVLYPLELLFTRWLRESPSTEIMVCRAV